MQITDLDWFSQITRELLITGSDGSVWSAIVFALILGLGTVGLGVGIAHRTQLLREEATGAEAVGVSLTLGLLCLASFSAAIGSGGHSVFVPITCALVVGVAGRREDAPVPVRWRSIAAALAAGALFVAVVALLYGATMTPSVRHGVQPVEYPDEAFYAVLSRDLAVTGRETTLSATGFGQIAGLPAQSWYHWGELWLGGAVTSAFGVDPMMARYQVVLPLMLHATALLSGTLVRVVLKTTSLWAFAFGAAASLFIVPVPFVSGPFFSSWAFGMALGITLYGLAAPIALLAVYAAATIKPYVGWPGAIFRGAIAAALLPAHIVVAGLAVVGTAATVLSRVRDLRGATPGLLRVIAASAGLLIATGVWGIATGHGLGGLAGTGPGRVAPFNETWSATIAITLVGGGILLAIPMVWLLRIGSAFERSLHTFMMAMVAFGAVVWGARLENPNAFYAYFAGLAVFAPSIAAIATLRVLQVLRDRRRLALAAALNILVAAQIAWGAAFKTMPALVASGPLPERSPIPTEVLAAIRGLPVGAKLAYSCRPLEEATFAQPQLLAIDVHTERRVVPLCFQADGSSWLVGGQRDPSIPNESWAWAPQRELYPDAESRPSAAEVATWLRKQGVGYIYVDAWRPSPVGAFATPVVTVGPVQLLALR